MTRTLRAVLITLGDPARLTGGYLFHRRLSELAPAHGAVLTFASVKDRGFPWSTLHGPGVVAEVRGHRPDVIVIDSIAAAYLAPALMIRRAGMPMLGMLHQPPGGIDHGRVRTFLQAQLDNLAYRYVLRLLVASESLAGDLMRQGERPERIKVVPPGRDVAAVVGTPPGDLRAGRRIALLCVGNWVERKDILSLLDAFARLDEAAATLHLVGSTDIEPKYAQRVRARLTQPDVVGRVRIHGSIGVSEVAALYAAADAFVLSSLKEPYGTVYGEAMACGLPVVGWRAGNLPYLAEHEREGLLVAPGDVAGLTTALRRLADDAGLRTRLGAAARQRAMSRPTWDEVAGLFFDQLRDVVGRSSV
jgi:glycosyltransferase involved in cell wall biosynthesis